MDPLDAHMLKQDVDQMTVRFMSALHEHVREGLAEKAESGEHSHLDAWDVMVGALRTTFEDHLVWYFAESIESF